MRAGSPQEFLEPGQKDRGRQQTAPGSLVLWLPFLEGPSAPHPPPQNPDTTEQGDNVRGDDKDRIYPEGTLSSFTLDETNSLCLSLCEVNPVCLLQF